MIVILYLILVSGYSKSKLFGELIKVCKLFHLNDIEIAMWCLIIENKIGTWDEFDPPVKLLVTAYQAKVSSFYTLGILQRQGR
jgi:hypothetical protein